MEPNPDVDTNGMIDQGDSAEWRPSLKIWVHDTIFTRTRQRRTINLTVSLEANKENLNRILGAIRAAHLPCLVLAVSPDHDPIPLELEINILF